MIAGTFFAGCNAAVLTAAAAGRQILGTCEKPSTVIDYF